MKKCCLLVLLACVLFACSQGEKRVTGSFCTIKGRYAAADGTVLYMTPFDDISAPVDSAVVEGGEFCFFVDDTVSAVRFIASQQVIDGGYVLLEPGVINVDFATTAFASGTDGNNRLGQFMHEKEKIINLRRMASPEVLAQLAVEPAMLDSIKEVAKMGDAVHEAYAMREIRLNIDNPLGYFFLVQSVGVVDAKKLAPMFRRVPLPLRDGLYEVMMGRVDAAADEASVAGSYAAGIERSLEATAEGKMFQNFELDDVEGGKVLFSDVVFANRYTLLFFWAGWAPGAEGDVAALAALNERYEARGLRVVGVSLDGSVQECATFAEKAGAEWVQLCNPAGGSAEVAAAYGVTQLPVAVLVNRQGVIVSRCASVEEVAEALSGVFK